MTTNDPYAGDYTLEEARTESVAATQGKIRSLVGEISDEFNRGLEQVRHGIAPGYDSNNRMPGALRVTALERVVATLRISGLTSLINGNVASTATQAFGALGPAARRGQQQPALGSGDTQRLQNDLETVRDQLSTQADFVEGMLSQLGLADLPWETSDNQQEILRQLEGIFQRSQQQPAPPQRRSLGNRAPDPLDPAPVPFDPNTSSDLDIEQTHLPREELKTLLEEWDREIGDSRHTLKHSLGTSGATKDERQEADTKHWRRLRSMTKPPELPWRQRS